MLRFTDLIAKLGPWLSAGYCETNSRPGFCEDWTRPIWLNCSMWGIEFWKFTKQLLLYNVLSMLKYEVSCFTDSTAHQHASFRVMGSGLRHGHHSITAQESWNFANSQKVFSSMCSLFRSPDKISTARFNCRAVRLNVTLSCVSTSQSPISSKAPYRCCSPPPKTRDGMWTVLWEQKDWKTYWRILNILKLSIAN